MNYRHRVNEQIRGVRDVRLIDADGKMVGVVPFFQALNKAQTEGLDLVEMNRNGNPPVCKLMDYGKFKYDNAKAAKEARKNQHVVEVKELTLRPATDTHDLLVKAKHVKEWLEDGDKVKITVRMKGRERVHPDQGVQVIRDLLAQVGSHKVEQAPRAEGKFITAMIAPC